MPGLGKLVGKAFNAGKREVQLGTGTSKVPEMRPDFKAAAQPWPHNDKLVAASYRIPKGKDENFPIPPNYAITTIDGEEYAVRKNLLNKKRIKETPYDAH